MKPSIHESHSPNPVAKDAVNTPFKIELFEKVEGQNNKLPLKNNED